MNNNIHREITPLTEGDCFLVFNRSKSNFDFPLHFHPEFEINYILNGQGAKRIVGDHTSLIDKYELVLVGSNLYHGWEQGECKSQKIHEITIQFHKDLFHGTLLKRNVMQPIKEMLEMSSRGIEFSQETIKFLQPRIENLAMKKGIDSFIELFSLLYDLSSSRNQQMLSTMQAGYDDFYNSDKIKAIYEYVETHFLEKIRVEDVAKKLNMTVISFSRLIKQRTGKTFVEFLNAYRIGYATRMLIETNQSISEIAFNCGFNNQANFNRIFKKAKGSSPTEFRETFAGIKRIN